MALALFTGAVSAASAAEHGRIVNGWTGRCLQANSYDGAVFTGDCGKAPGDGRALWAVRADGVTGRNARIFWSDGGCLASGREHTVVVSQWCKDDNSVWVRARDGRLVNLATGRCLTDEGLGYAQLSSCRDGLGARQAWRTGAG
ncbi:RICIN domain-containing protein [Streptacidiphilus melanogenes]|uniref:RICIN domain-containing protein n=1 Tax=Streptacidiphilus melanogenes TaxID=411235 RepID=UPI0005A859C7|nr:RICIN domain-containing protein [Streptacidiphilus melanogenes]